MNYPFGEETHRRKMATAQATFGLAVRLHSEIIAGRIRRTIYERTVYVITGGPGMVLPPSLGSTKQDLLAGTYNLVIMALGASALTADETLLEALGPIDERAEPARLGLRVMVHQLRNAFAHNPWRPKWRIYQQYRHEYDVPLITGDFLSFDARKLHGDGVKPEHIGGLESWVKVLQYCESILPQ